MQITPKILEQLAGGHRPLAVDLADSLNKRCPPAGIDSPGPWRHFLAQACHETDGFNTLQEYATGDAYEGRHDLGNTQPGDGVRFKGRGIFQTTGRANYLAAGEVLSKENPEIFVDAPQLLCEPHWAVASALVFWISRKLLDISKMPDVALVPGRRAGLDVKLTPFEYISYRINGGYNGLANRKRLYLLAKELIK